MKERYFPINIKVPWNEGYLSRVSFLYKGMYRKERFVLTPTTSIKQIMFFLGKFAMKDQNPNHYRDVDIDIQMHLVRKNGGDDHDEQLKLF